MKILGIDPGLASCGWAVIERDDDGSLSCLGAGVIRTKKETGNKYFDDLLRIKALSDGLEAAYNKWDGIQFIASESMSWPRHTRAVQSMGFCWGVIGSLFNHESIIQRRPQQIKVDLAGKKTATKQDVEQAACLAVTDLALYLNDLPKTQRDHAADAAAAVVSSWNDSVVKLAWKFSRS